MYAKEFLTGLKSLRKITGLGEKTASKLENELNITSIHQLQNCEKVHLQKIFGNDMALRLKQLANGVDESAIKQLEKPKSISFENSFRPISTKSLSIRCDAAAKFQALLSRLINQIQDDCRIPTTLKITLRKYDSVKKSSIRESRQCIFPSNCFKTSKGKLLTTEGAEEKIMKNILCLFDRMVDLKHSFSITLIGLCFNKFQKESGPGAMAKYLMKKQNVEVQSITNISNEILSNDPFSFRTASPSSSLNMDVETLSNNSLDILSGSDDDNLIEPSPKKRKKIDLCLAQSNHNFSSSNENVDVVSPTKLNVSNLRLNGNSSLSSDFSHSMEMPQNVDPSVWQEIPSSIKRELILNWQKAEPITNSSNPSNTSKGNNSKLTKITNNTLHKYFLKN